MAPLVPEPGQRVVQGHVAAADRRGAGAAVGLEHVAVDDDLALAQGRHVAHRPQGPADQPLDLLAAARRPAVLDLPPHPLGRRARQHRVLGRHPAGAPSPHPAGHVLVDRGGAQHPGLPEADQARARRHLGEVALEGDRSQLVGGSSVGSHRPHGNRRRATRPTGPAPARPGDAGSDREGAPTDGHVDRPPNSPAAARRWAPGSTPGSDVGEHAAARRPARGRTPPPGGPTGAGSGPPRPSAATPRTGGRRRPAPSAPGRHAAPGVGAVEQRPARRRRPAPPASRPGGRCGRTARRGRRR